MAGKSLLQQLTDGIADAITDIREKLVEEPWWGRSLSDKSDDRGPSWGEATTPKSFGTHTHEIEPSHDRDQGIDR